MRPDTTNKLGLRTPSSDTRRSSVTGFVRDANQAGWSKASAQMMQTVIFGVGLYDVCSDP